jgi:hypothetical protein
MNLLWGLWESRGRGGKRGVSPDLMIQALRRALPDRGGGEC